MDLIGFVATLWGLVPVLVMWLGAAVKVPGAAVRGSDEAAGAITLTLASFALSMTLAVPPVYYGVSSLTGVPNLARLLSDLLAIAAVNFLREFLLATELDRGLRTRQRRIGRRWATVAGAAMIILFFAFPIDVDTVSDMILHGHSPFFAYRHVYLLTLGAGLVDAIRRTLLLRRQSVNGSIRASLSVHLVAQLLGLLQVSSNLVEVAIHAYGGGLSSRPYGQAEVIVSVLAIFCASSVTIVVWFADRLLPGVARRWSARRRLAELRPLWQELVRNAPDVVLPAPNWHRADPTGLLAVEERLYRTAVEIRDAYLVLRNHIPPEMADLVRSLVRPGDDEEAEIEAALLRVAIVARAVAIRAEPTSSALGVTGGSTLDDEARWLARVARAFHGPTAATAACLAVERLEGSGRLAPTGG